MGLDARLLKRKGLRTRLLRRRACSVAAALLFILAGGAAEGQSLPARGLTADPEHYLSDKQNRTPAERKLDSTLLYAMRALMQDAIVDGNFERPVFVQNFIAARVQADNTIPINLRGTVSDELVAAVVGEGGVEVDAFPAFDTLTARVPASALLRLAQRPDVRFIGPPEEGETNRHLPAPDELERLTRALARAPAKVGSVTSQGVVAHGADKAIATGIDGAGVKVCVLADAVTSLVSRQMSGDISPSVAVLPGQEGTNGAKARRCSRSSTTWRRVPHSASPPQTLEHRAVRDQYPQPAQHGRLQDVIIDDYTYFEEGAFQDGNVAQAVNAVTAAGVLYFSSAGNSGNLTHGTSGTFGRATSSTADR